MPPGALVQAEALGDRGHSLPAYQEEEEGRGRGWQQGEDAAKNSLDSWV